MVVVSCPLRQMTSPAMDFDWIYSTRHGFPPVKWVSDLIIEQLAIPTAVVPLLHMWAHLTWWFGLEFCRVHKWVRHIDAFSSPTACIASSSNVKASQQGRGFWPTSSLISLYLSITKLAIWSCHLVLLGNQVEWKEPVLFRGLLGPPDWHTELSHTSSWDFMFKFHTQWD